MSQKISSEQKARILEEATVPGCSISNIAKRYNITRCTIYAWLKV